jgi:hypothetical protein
MQNLQQQQLQQQHDLFWWFRLMSLADAKSILALELPMDGMPIEDNGAAGNFNASFVSLLDGVEVERDESFWGANGFLEKLTENAWMAVDAIKMRKTNGREMKDAILPIYSKNDGQINEGNLWFLFQQWMSELYTENGLSF